MKESEAYKTYYAFSTGKAIPKPKYVRRTTKEKTVQAHKASSEKRIKPAAKVTRSGKKKQLVKGLETLSEISLSKAEQMKLAIERRKTQLHSSQPNGSGAHEGTGVTPGVPDVPTYGSDDEQISWKSSDEEDDDDEDSDEEIQGANVEGDKQDKEETNKEVETNELYRDVKVNLEERDIEMTNVQQTNIQPTQVTEDTHVIIPLWSILKVNNRVLLYVPVTAIAEPPLLSVTTTPPPPTPLITHLFDHRLKTLENNFSEFNQTNQFAVAISLIPDIIDAYLANKMHEAVKTVVQLQSERLRDEAQAKNADFINKLDDNIKKIIKNQVKEQVKAQVSKILPKIEKTVNEQLEAKILTRSSNESKISPAVAANLSELELKKILIDKMESNDEDKDKEPSAGLNRGSKRRRAGKEPESISAPKEKTSKAFGKSTEGSLAQMEGPHESFNELMDTPFDFSAFVMNRLKVDTLTPELLTGPTFKLMKGSCKSLVELKYFLEEVYKATTDQLDWNNPEGQQYPHDLRKPLPLIPNSRGRQVIPFDHFINNDLAYLSGGDSSRKYTTSVTKTKAADYGHIKWIEDLVPNTMESARDVYSKRRIIVVTKLEIVEWQNYKHLDWITVYMLLLLVQGKLTNLTVEERLAFSVSLRMFTRSIVIQRRVEDLQLAYSNPRGFIYQNKDKKNRLMHIDELHKFSDVTLNDVWTALNDRLKGIQMKYLPQTIWRQSDRDKARAMIQAIDKQLKTRRIMRSLEKFVGGRPYEEHAEFDESNTYVLERFYTSTGNPIKEILLKLNLPDHKSILTDSKEYIKMDIEVPDLS
ncbi:hypothetical protein Tco_1458615 [Tanacetum coccineum]